MSCCWVRRSSVGCSARGAVMIDPVFAAIAAAREAHARFERALRTENFTVDVSLREAMRELAATVPTTVAGVAALTGFVREMTRELGNSFFERLPALAADLVNRKVAVIAAISGTPAALATKAATTTIPIVFAIGGDPITPGLVASLNRPGGNVTGVSFYNSPVVTKRLDLARELVPDGSVIALLGNPDNPGSVEETKAAE